MTGRSLEHRIDAVNGVILATLSNKLEWDGASGSILSAVAAQLLVLPDGIMYAEIRLEQNQKPASDGDAEYSKYTMNITNSTGASLVDMESGEYEPLEKFGNHVFGVNFGL